MSGSHDCAELEKTFHPSPPVGRTRPVARTGSAVASAQRPTPKDREQAPNVQLKNTDSKKRWMMISTFPRRSGFCSRRFVRPIVRWIDGNLMRRARLLG